MAPDPRPPELHELDRPTCLTLLASQRVGRLVLPGAEPFVAPVNYVLVDEAVIYRSDDGSPLALADGATVVFEVDLLDDREHGGWSVVVRGTVEDVTPVVAELREHLARLEPWAPGPKDRWLRLPVTEVTGRWLRGGEQVSAL